MDVSLKPTTVLKSIFVNNFNFLPTKCLNVDPTELEIRRIDYKEMYEFFFKKKSDDDRTEKTSVLI